MAYEDILRRWKSRENTTPRYMAWGTRKSGEITPVQTNVQDADEQMALFGALSGKDKLGPGQTLISESTPVGNERPDFVTTLPPDQPALPQQGMTLGYPDVQARARVEGTDMDINPAGTATSGQLIRRRFIQSNPNAVSPAERSQVQAQIAKEAASVAPKAAPGEGELVEIEGRRYRRNRYGELVEDKFSLAEQGTTAKAAEAQKNRDAQMARIDKVLASREGISSASTSAAMDRVRAQIKASFDLAKAEGRMPGTDEANQKINDIFMLHIAEAEKTGNIETANQLKIKQWAIEHPQVTTQEVTGTNVKGETTQVTTTRGPMQAPTASDAVLGRELDTLEKDISDGRWDDPKNLEKARKLVLWAKLNPTHPFVKQANRIINLLNENDKMPKEKDGAAK